MFFCVITSYACYYLSRNKKPKVATSFRSTLELIVISRCMIYAPDRAVCMAHRRVSSKTRLSNSNGEKLMGGGEREINLIFFLTFLVVIYLFLRSETCQKYTYSIIILL